MFFLLLRAKMAKSKVTEAHFHLTEHRNVLLASASTNQSSPTHMKGRITMTQKGGFTLPGEAGYEKLTLRMAEKWGADVIRDSDGTKLSDEILNAGYDIYATICIIRDHNEYAKAHPAYSQQTFLISEPVVARSQTVEVPLLNGFFTEQFRINDDKDGFAYWQVYDRTTDTLVPNDKWCYNAQTQCVCLRAAVAYHRYTVSFLCYRIWEEINMYNHTTNQWQSEHLMQLDPRHDDVQSYMLTWLENWCQQHPYANVVRFTSLFYNFVFIWGNELRNRHLFSDWASYDFTVSPRMLELFSQQYGYALTAEDFVNKGLYQVTHMPPTQAKRDYMTFVMDFVVSLGKKLVDIVHKYGKKAYVFYDDSWVGLEPYGGRFGEFGFDGLIKCVFSGFEARLCAGVDVPTHELRLHPYLFPTGLGGAPTFSQGGNPTLDAQQYWVHVRRALLRQPIERIGLGGYLHLVENDTAFCDYIETLANDFRTIKALHAQGSPYTQPIKVAVLHTWGKLRSWTLSGHFHETYMHDLIHINEALSGLPVEVTFMSFEDVKNGMAQDVQVIINAGRAADAWSGGAVWADDVLVSTLTQWVDEGGILLGVKEPSACANGDTFFRMAHVLGVDEDCGARVCHGRWTYAVEPLWGVNAVPNTAKLSLMLTDSKARVLADESNIPTAVVHTFGRGMGIYLASFQYSNQSVRMLLDLLLQTTRLQSQAMYITDNAQTECAYFPSSKALVVLNNSDCPQCTKIRTPLGMQTIQLAAFEMKVCTVDF